MAPATREDPSATQRKERYTVTRPVSNPPERYLWPHEVAHLLNVHPKTVNLWARGGKLPFVRTLGRHRRFPESEILRLRDHLTSRGAS